MCTSNSDCTGGSRCVQGKCQGGSNPPTEPPPIPPLTDIQREEDQDVEED